MASSINLDLQKLLDGLQTFIAVLDSDGKVVFINSTPIVAAGIIPADVLGRYFWDCFWFNYDSEVRVKIKRLCKSCLSGEVIIEEIALKLKGDIVWIDFSMHPVFDNLGNIVQVVPEGRIITQRKQAEEKLSRLNFELEEEIKKRTIELEEANQLLNKLALTDALTGLPNRRHLEEYVEREIAQAKRDKTSIAIMYIDMDGFKAVNDEIGHEAGDMVLIKFADRFKTFIRKNELIARIGGDEFSFVIPHFNNKNDLQKTAQRLLNECTGKVKLESTDVEVGLSIGIAIYPNNGQTYEKLRVAADTAMYSVKKNTKGTYAFAVNK